MKRLLVFALFCFVCPLLHCESRENIQAKYNETVWQINDHVRSAGRHQAWRRLAQFTDMFGARMVGSEALEHSIDHLYEEFRKEGFDNVHVETVSNLPCWRRGVELAVLTSTSRPSHNMRILGLGGSVPTPPGGLRAAVVVVRDFDELENRSSEVAGRIVVFNQEFRNYPYSALYRTRGATRAAAHGAVAALIRSATPLSINTPHTGFMAYDPDVKRIPGISVTVEDAEMIGRMAGRGERVEITLEITSAPCNESVSSRNLVAEIRGSELPDEVVLFSGHVDSWDVGEGAMDDGGGIMVGWQALSVVKALKLRPRRTMRLVIFTAEEWGGGLGGKAYFEAHKETVASMALVMESDMGVFRPYGFRFNGVRAACHTMWNVSRLLIEPIDAGRLFPTSGSVGADIGPWLRAGVPALSPVTANNHYFYFHHSEGDTVTVYDPAAMDNTTILWTTVAFVVADMETRLPHKTISKPPSK